MNLPSFGLGGASVHFQMLSPESRKYFNNAIVMSGTAFNYWAMSPYRTHVDEAHEMANKWNQSQHSLTGLVDLLKSVPAQKLIEFSSPPFESTLNFTFAPVVEG